MPRLTLADDILAAALEGFEAQKQRIETRIAEIQQMLDGVRTQATAPTKTAKPRKKRSLGARRRMALAQRARYASLKQGSEPPPEIAKPKRKLSAAGRKNIIEATKRRWAAVKAAKQPGKPAVAIKGAASVKGPRKSVTRKPKTATKSLEHNAAAGA